MAASFTGNQPVVSQGNLVNSTIPSDSESELSEDPEPMEYVPTTVSTLDGCKDTSPVVPAEDAMQVETEMPSVVIDKDCCMTNPENFTREDLGLLVDFFYTPFDHGMTSTQLLQDLHFLKVNAGVVVQGQAKTNLAEATAWMEAADKFLAVVQKVDRMIRLLQMIPNTAVVHEFFSYLWDLQGLIQLCACYVQWLKLGQIKESALPSCLNHLLILLHGVQKGIKNCSIVETRNPGYFGAEFRARSNVCCRVTVPMTFS